MSEYLHPLHHSEKAVLLDFYADWCAPCSWLEPVLTEVEAALSQKLEIRKINIDKEPALADFYKIQSVPVLILLVDGEIRWRMNGFLFAKELIPILEKQMAAA